MRKEFEAYAKEAVLAVTDVDISGGGQKPLNLYIVGDNLDELAKYALELQQKKHVPLDEICGAVGQMLAGLMSGLRMLPASAARWLVGLREFHQIKAKLETELDSVLASLNCARYMEDVAPAVIDRVLADRTKENRDDDAESKNNR